MNNPDLDPRTLNPDSDTNCRQKQSQSLDFYRVDSRIQIKIYSRPGIFIGGAPPPPWIDATDRLTGRTGREDFIDADTTGGRIC